MTVMTCENCGKKFVRYDKRSNHTFCSRKCYNIWKVGSNNSNWQGGDVQFICEWCGKKFGVRRDRITSQSGKFCSVKCFKYWSKSIAMPERQRMLSKMSLKNMTYWLRKGVQTTIDWQFRYGYTPEQFRNHIESQWRDGMSWDNYGDVWQIDHIKAIQFFNFTSYKDSDFKECFALENLQPLFSEENLMKGRKDKNDIFWRG
ncbi:MAG: hypothetical protein PVG39_01305 [Desulfobacteraceae bacterium]|jgi:hypothetical protein